jgi:hypothetical protein
MQALKTKQNYAWDRFYFYTSLKTKQKLCLDQVSFLRKLEPEETMLGVSGFIFTQA